MRPELKNLLGNETSLYLQQHKDNPVHWLPYNQQSLQLAKSLNRPIFLSIGYSSCHWCHVMAHESFENQEIANLLNQNFINIKIDREELPDVDQFYQKVGQAYGRGGGWPLSVFLLPDETPIFVGTYFPPESKGQMMGFPNLCQQILQVAVKEEAQIRQKLPELQKFLHSQLEIPEEIKKLQQLPSPSSIIEALDAYADKTYGSYAKAPKFPHFAFFEWFVEQTLEGLIEEKHKPHLLLSVYSLLGGGIMDQVRGGIHRYSTDEFFLVPHFEKMLYDQAGLLRLQSKLAHLAPSPLLFDGLYFTLDYLQKEMLGEHYFFASQDADSEGFEGLYFTYTYIEAIQVLADVFPGDSAKHNEWLKWMGVSKEGNFEEGLNVISLAPSTHQNIFPMERWSEWRKIKEALWQERKKRIPPATDTKGIASWNFMLMSSLADVLQYCFIPEIKQKALELWQESYPRVLKTFCHDLRSPNLPLHHVTTLKNDGVAYFEDYAFFAEMLLRSYEITADTSIKSYLHHLLPTILQNFYHQDRFYTRSNQSEQKNLRSIENLPQEALDSSYRSATATFLFTLKRASALFNDDTLLEVVRPLLSRMRHEVLLHPFGAGEGLRCMTYPEEIFRVIKVPKSFAAEKDFHHFIANLPQRFVLDYSDEESWQVCSLKACELRGKDLAELLDAFRSKAKEA